MLQSIVSFFNRLTEDRIALFFLTYMVIVLGLNILKNVLIWVCAKSERDNYQCEFLVVTGINQNCSSAIYKKRFKRKNNSCKGCFGRNVQQSKEDLERKARNTGPLVALIILLANWGKSLLPYAAILFTLLSKMIIKP